jgi:hypothetical protein
VDRAVEDGEGGRLTRNMYYILGFIEVWFVFNIISH